MAPARSRNRLLQMGMVSPKEQEMQKRTLIKAAAAGVVSAMVTSTARAQKRPPVGDYADIEGVEYYYEVAGSGEPVLLLHGGLFSIGMYEQWRSDLAASRQVIAVDLHGHGRTALGSRVFSVKDQGRDMAALVRHLGFEQADVVGHSMGGGVAFQMAIQAPQTVRRLSLVSTPFAQQGYLPEMLPQQAQVGPAMAPMMRDTAMYRAHMAVAPFPNEYPTLLDQMGDYIRDPFDWSSDFDKLIMPVMLVFGDADIFRLEHIVSFYQRLGGGLKDPGWARENIGSNRLAILPDVTHYDMIASPQVVPAILPFIDGKTGLKPN
jgi:pimeloyl-ACP methyl ester carboxylesterase